VALAAIADDADLLALDQVQVGVAIVINTHGRSSWLGGRSARIIMFSGCSAAPAYWFGWRFPALSSPFLTSGETRFCMAHCRIMRP
jgi:hypothetical protein